MNSYWVEHQATHHVDDLRAGAAGDQLVRQAEAAESVTPGPRPADWRPAGWRQTVQRALASLQATARRSHRRATELR
jgi:hypothetical protein